MKPILVSSPRYWSLKGYKLHERLISYMSLNQDSKCDVDCQGCFRYPERKNGLKNLLNINDYEELLNKFSHFGGIAIEISGEGEPLLSTNTLPIIRLATKLQLWTTLITNGHLLNQSIIEELKDLKVALVISLNSLSESVYEETCRLPGIFHQKIINIDLSARVFKNSGWLEKGRVIKRLAIHQTLQKNNLNEVANMRKFCNERDMLLSISPIAHIGQASQHPELWLSEEEKLLAHIEELGDESIILYDEPSGRSVCGTCRYGLNIGADGNLLLDAHGGYEVNIANILEISFEKAIYLQRSFAQKMFETLDGFCPLRHPKWNDFVKFAGWVENQ